MNYRVGVAMDFGTVGAPAPRALTPTAIFLGYEARPAAHSLG